MGRPTIYREGQRLHHFTLLTLTGDRTEKGLPLWHAVCDCGARFHVVPSSKGRTSCGCRSLLKHGHARRARSTRAYRAWKAMRSRATNERLPYAENYALRGIDVCDRWASFDAFLEDMGDPPAGCWLERVDNNRGYHPENCRWSTPREQRLNQRPRKISRDEARAIYIDKRPHAVIAERYGVSRSLVTLIKSGRVWRHATCDMR